ncbi:fructuronate reductase [Nakamurella sp. UYEF19]|uniref:mannitol dehydrogenase family protein n=1 Tax=Nakamurella sp. UYEF19 TaxID=1756392 RepID=UPI003396AAE0
MNGTASGSAAGDPVPDLTRGPADRVPPVRLVHLGLGNFFRAHQAWYTANAPDAADWGIAAFTGRSTRLADELTAQDGLYTLITRSATGDSAEILGSLVRAHAGTDIHPLVRYLADPAVAVVTLTVTEAGYVRGADGHLDLSRPEVVADLRALQEGLSPLVLQTAPARLVAGLAARRASGAGPLAVVSCDNLPDNGHVIALVVGDLADQLDAGLRQWIDVHVSFVTTMVDRITPATIDGDRATAAELTGRTDAAPVVTEPFSEWVLCGDFPAGRPGWDSAGARFVPDVVPFEERKLWLLNGGHSLLAYAGSARGHLTIAEAMADPVCRGWLDEWWQEATPHLTLPASENADYRDALVARFTNQAIRHLLAQIAGDGSQKIAVRILPVLRLERKAGRMPPGAVRAVAAWINHLRGAGAPVKDSKVDVADLAAGSLDEAVTGVLEFLDPSLAADGELLAAVATACRELS